MFSIDLSPCTQSVCCGQKVLLSLSRDPLSHSQEDNVPIDRRDFLKFGITGVVALAGSGVISWLGENAFLSEHLRASSDASAANFYRGMVNYDRVVRTTCAGNCTQSCGWNAYIRGKTLVRIEPAADYDKYDPVAGNTYSPRGCVRGATYPQYIYGPTRIKTPLIRTGPRGSGQFRRASWDEALDLITERWLHIIRDEGPESLAVFSPIPAYGYVSAGCGYRLGRLMGAAGPLSFYDWYCDLPAGEPETWGVQTEECEEWDWVNSRLLILWGANVAESRMAATHFVTEAKYQGCKVVSILSDYNATSKIADAAICPLRGTDGALALGLVREIIAHNWHDPGYIRTFTDLPFLIRKDNQAFLREKDMAEGGSAYRLYVWDTKSGAPALAPGTMGDDRDSLDWEAFGIRPALDFSGTVRLVTGEEVKVETAWYRLRRMLDADYTLDQVADTTQVNVKVIADLAREIGTRRPVSIIEGGGINHWYHNDLNNRAMILLMAVTGNVGVNGGGFHQYTGQYKVWLKGLAEYVPLGKAKCINGTLFVWAHMDKELWRLNRDWKTMVRNIEDGELTKLPDGSRVSADPEDEMGYRHYLLIKSMRDKVMPVYPAPPARPRSMLIWRGNFLNNAKGGYKVLEWFRDEQKMEFVVTLDFRMCTTALYSDVVLPAASWYEKLDLTSTPMHPYFQIQQAAIDPVFESKPDFTIMKRIAERIQKKARQMKAQGIWDGTYRVATGDVLWDYTRLYDNFVDKKGKENPYFKGHGDGALDSPEKVAHYIVRNSPILYPDTKRADRNRKAFGPEVSKLVQELKRSGDKDAFASGILGLAQNGPVPFPALQPTRPHNPFRENVEQKLPWPGGGKHKYDLTISKYPCMLPVETGKTLTGRQQFYIDHSTYIALGETLPVWKKPEEDLVDGKPGKLKLNTPHARFKTHSTFSEVDILLRLQRGEPVVMINTLDARERHIKDGDTVEVYNDYGSFVCKAMVLPGIGRYELRIDHAWEKFQYIQGYFNNLTPIRPNPTTACRYPEEEDAPDYHLHFAWNLWGVCGNECDTSVEIRRV
jgi:complex iron-sulfur molybdoenzyme family reductase subunit alpha